MATRRKFSEEYKREAVPPGDPAWIDLAIGQKARQVCDCRRCSKIRSVSLFSLRASSQSIPGSSECVAMGLLTSLSTYCAPTSQEWP